MQTQEEWAVCVSRGVIGVVGICPKFTLGRGEIRRRGTQSRQRMKCRKPWKHSEWSGGGGETKITTRNQEETLEHETVFTFQNDSKFQIPKHSKIFFHFFFIILDPRMYFVLIVKHYSFISQLQMIQTCKNCHIFKWMSVLDPALNNRLYCIAQNNSGAQV